MSYIALGLGIFIGCAIFGVIQGIFLLGIVYPMADWIDKRKRMRQGGMR
jgi:hypothetical protein